MGANKNNVLSYIAIFLVVSVLLGLAFAPESVSSDSGLPHLIKLLHKPVVFVLIILIWCLSLIGLINQILRHKRIKEKEEVSFQEVTSSLVRPVRLYVVSDEASNISIRKLTDISEHLARIARRGDAGVVDMMDFIIFSALQVKASDIHLEPAFDNVVLKYRLDGVLHDVGEIPKNLLTRLISRLRVLANLTIFHRGKPQDGRIDVRSGSNNWDVRLSIMPTLHGEKAVLRLFESGDHGFEMSKLGMSREVYESLSEILLKPQGTILLTGPTGSGKTTTIYAAIRHILENKAQTTNIITIEDPIECEIMGINQIQVNPKRDLTFSSSLRSMLRQDPDVIMVGEIRDFETAKIATQAGMTGHLIISSIHANSSVGVFNRLIEMGIEPFLVASSVTGILSQRLVRRNCPHCREPAMPSLKTIKALGIPLDENMRFMKGKGCEACQYRGYKGRIGVFEFLKVTMEIKDALQRKVSTTELFNIARKHGLITLKEDGLEKVRKGIIDLDELSRVVDLAEPGEVVF